MLHPFSANFFLSCFLFTAVVVGSSVDAKTPAPSGPQNSQLEFLSVLQDVLGRIPGKNGCAVREYTDVLRVDKYTSDTSVAGSNAGFINLMEEQYRSSQCFRVALKKFYQEIENVDLQTPQRLSFLNKNGAPKFSASVSDLNQDKFKPGFLFDMAKKVAGDDPRLAFQLIAFCGHDDVSQTSEEETSDIAIQCPSPASLMYFNGSLVSVGKTQQPIAGELALEQSRGITAQTPTKNYHVLMGAFVGCRLAEACQIDAKEASQYERKVALAYRLFRLKSNANRIQTKYKSVLEKYFTELRLNKIKKQPFEYLKELVFEQLKSEHLKNFGSEKSSESISTQKNEAKLSEDADREAKRILTLSLFDEFMLTNSFKLIGEVKLKEQKIGTDQKDEAFDYLGFKSGRTQKLCREISPDQCDSVLNELKSWNADLIWTANQHSMGAKFGAVECAHSAQERAGGRPKVCSQYDQEPDVAPTVRNKDSIPQIKKDQNQNKKAAGSASSP